METMSNMRISGLSLSFLVLSLFSSACDRHDPEPAAATTTPAENTPAPSAKKPEAPAGPVVTASEFELRAVADADGYAAGELAQFSVSVIGRGGWHVNQEFPVSVELEGPSAVQFPKKALEKGDAAEFTEERARFDVPFTAKEAGSHRVEANVRFAICTDENCIPEERKLALELPVR